MGRVWGPFSSVGARAMMVAVTATLGVAGCGRHPLPLSQSPTSPSSSSPSSRTAVTLPPPAATPSTAARTPPSPPTTAWVASAPQPSPDLAAAQLVGAWAAGQRSTAAAVASPAAVAELFAVAYPGQALTISRGCSSEFLPIVCTYGPAGGASASDAVFELYASPTPGGWYVSSVRILG